MVTPQLQAAAHARYIITVSHESVNLNQLRLSHVVMGVACLLVRAYDHLRGRTCSLSASIHKALENRRFYDRQYTVWSFMSFGLVTDDP